VNAAGTDSGDQASWGPILTPDGTKVVFESYASNLGPTDTNQKRDIYVRDLTTGITELVSINAAGTDSANNESQWPALSPDGTKVVFRSRATDIASPTPPSMYDQLYVRDLTTGTTTMISVNADGTGGGDGDSANDLFSPDGTKILFISTAVNLISPPSEVRGGLYERDLTSGTTTRLADGWGGVYSPSGDAIAYVGGGGVMLRNRAAGTAVEISTGTQGIVTSAPFFSHDGNRIAFRRETSTTSSSRTNIYVYDRAARTVTLATPASVGAGGSNGNETAILGFHPSDANKLLFYSNSSNLVANDTNSSRDVFVRDLAKRTTTPIALKAGSTELSTGSSWGCWVGDGSKVAFVAGGRDLGPRNTTSTQIFLRDLTTGKNTLVSMNAAGDNGGDRQSGVYQPIRNLYFFIYDLSVSADGKRIAFGSQATDFGPTDSVRNGYSWDDQDIYVASLVTPPSS
jgi:Tol biopolymer transport system component